MKLTKTSVDGLEPREKPWIMYDQEIKGFGVRIGRSGHKAWIVEYRPGAGGRGVSTKRLKLGDVTVLTLDKARTAAKTALAKARLGDDLADQREKDRSMPTIAEYSAVFMKDHVEAKRKPRTAEKYQDHFDRLVNPQIGNTKLHLLTAKDVTGLHLRIGRENGQATANRVLTTLSSMFGYAVRIGGFTCPNPIKNIERFKESFQERYLSSEELAAVGAALIEGESVGIPWDVDETKPTAKHIQKKNRLTFIDRFAAAATAVACSRLRVNSNWRDHVREGARQLLILIGGGGITTLLRQELESEHYWVRHTGLNWAFVRRDDGIIERLAAIARRPIPRDANGKPESEPYLEFHQAMCRLAALGADSILVDILLETGVTEVPVDLASLRAHQGPLPSVLTEKAAATLANEAAAENELRIALVIAWLSGKADLIPAVREVMRKADPASSVAGYACIALHELGDESEEFARLASKLARAKENAHWALNALANLGDRGTDLLLEWLQSPETALRADYEDFVIRVLYAHSATRAQAVAAAVAACLRNRRLGDAPFDIAAEATDPTLRDQILDKAFAVRSFIVTEPLHAIEGLAKFDMVRAVDAIELALQSHPKIERQLCRLLVRLAPEAAPEKLINAAVMTERESWLGHILTDELPAVFEQHANEALRQRIQREK
jgi:hypothetical protein